MAKSPNVSSSVFGWDFQSNAAIVLMIKNIEEASKIRIEGAKQDIEITLNDGKIIYSQAKSVNDPEDYTNVLSKLQEALKTLTDVAKEPDVDSLIYITNSPNPFSNIRTMYAFSSNITLLKYAQLSNVCKNKIESICKKGKYDLNKNLLSICVLQFHGDGENRYKVVKDIINEFLDKIGVGEKGYGQKMLEIWQRDFSLNASQHKLNTTITKKRMIWPLIVLLCVINREDSLLNNLGETEFEEIKHKYEVVISNNTERFTFITKVMALYNEYKIQSSIKDKERIFIEKHWHEFKDEFELPTATDEILKNVVKLSIANVLKNQFKISEIKKAVKLL